MDIFPKFIMAIGILSLIFCFIDAYKRLENEKELKLAQMGLVQKIVDGKVIWVKP